MASALALSGVQLYVDQPDTTDTSYVLGDDGVLSTTSTASHNMWSAREDALFLWTDLPASPAPWVAAVQVRFAGSVSAQQCGLVPYAGPDGSMAAVHLGLNQWGDVHCSDAAHANFQATDWGTSRVAAGSGDFNADIRNCTLGDGTLGADRA